MIIHGIEKTTPGGRHAWLDTSIGRIRKPMGTFEVGKDEDELAKEKVLAKAYEIIFWDRVRSWCKPRQKRLRFYGQIIVLVMKSWFRRFIKKSK